MFSSGPNYTKLKTNVRLALNRLKLLEKKKSELAQKARKEIADYLATGKIERARIRVEHIIREDYLVEAMEIIEMYCDLLLARFGLVTQMKELDDGIAEAVSSLVWVCPRLQSDVPELKVISDIFIQKYGPQFAERARTATGEHYVSEKLTHKLQLQAPPKLLVEKYLVEIAKNYNVEYEPDPQVMKDESKDQNNFLIDLSDRNNLGGGGSGPPPQMGFIGYPSVPPLPSMPQPPTYKPFNYPPPSGGNEGGGGAAGFAGASSSQPFAYNIPPNAESARPTEKKDLNINTNFINEAANNFNASASSENGSPEENLLNAKLHDPPPRYSSINAFNLQGTNKPTPQPRSNMKSPPGAGSSPSAPPDCSGLSNLPNVPSDSPDMRDDDNAKPGNDDDIDFDDLSRRFANLKKRK